MTSRQVLVTRVTHETRRDPVTSRQVLVTRVTPETRRDLETSDDLDERFISSMVGFSRVIRHLRLRQRPIAGHNCLLDLMLIHNLFIAPLPGQ